MNERVHVCVCRCVCVCVGVCVSHMTARGPDGLAHPLAIPRVDKLFLSLAVHPSMPGHRPRTHLQATDTIILSGIPHLGNVVL